MSKKTYRLTDQATVEMRRAAPHGTIVLSDRGAFYELLRGTVEFEKKPAAADKAATPAGA